MKSTSDSYCLLLIDAANGEELDAIQLEGRFPDDRKVLVPDTDFVWVLCEHQLVHRIDLSDRTYITFTFEGYGHLETATLFNDSVWIGTEQGLLKLSRKTGETLHQINNVSPKHLATSANEIWAGESEWLGKNKAPWNTHQTTITAFNPAGEIIHIVNLDGYLFELCADKTSLWAATANTDHSESRIYQIDPSTGRFEIIQEESGYTITQLVPTDDGLFCLRSDAWVNEDSSEWLCQHTNHQLEPLIPAIYSISPDAKWALHNIYADDGSVQQRDLVQIDIRTGQSKPIFSSPHIKTFTI